MNSETNEVWRLQYNGRRNTYLFSTVSPLAFDVSIPEGSATFCVDSGSKCKLVRKGMSPHVFHL